MFLRPFESSSTKRDLITDPTFLIELDSSFSQRNKPPGTNDINKTCFLMLGNNFFVFAGFHSLTKKYVGGPRVDNFLLKV